MTHHCHARDCTTPCRPEMLMCRPHWSMVPVQLQHQVYAHYRKGQCNDKRPSKEWIEAAKAAIETVWAKESKQAQLLEGHPFVDPPEDRA